MPSCSFCERADHEVPRLISSGSQFICNCCVDQCIHAILLNTPPGSASVYLPITADLLNRASLGSKPESTRRNCAFCGRKNEDVWKLFSGTSSSICNECIDQCIASVKDTSSREQAEEHLPHVARFAADWQSDRRTEGFGSRKHLGKVSAWSIGLAISIALGAIVDLFLSESSRHAALEFQQRALIIAGSLSPSRLAEIISESATEAGADSGGCALLGCVVQGSANFIGRAFENLASLNILSAFVALILALLSIAAWVLFFVALIEDIGQREEGFRISDIYALICVPLIAAAVASALGLLLCSGILWVIKWIGIVALQLLGGVISLAGLSAMIGAVSFPVYYVVVKAIERKGSEVSEGVTRKILNRIARLL